MMSLLQRCALPPCLCCLVLLLAVGIGQLQARQQRALGDASAARREAWERSLQTLEDLHVRAMRRGREALLERELPSTLAILQWHAEHHADDVRRVLHGVLRALGEAPQQGALNARQADRLDRLRRALLQVGDAAGQLSPVFAALRQAAAAGDAAALRLARLEMERADRSLAARLGFAGEMARALAAAEVAQTEAGVLAVPWWAWGGLLALVAICLVWATQPLRRLERLASGSPEAAARSAAAPSCREEGILARRLVTHEASLRDRDARLDDGHRELTRQALATRRAEHELALLRFYSDNLVNSLRSAIVVSDAGGKITAINRTARRLLGLGDAEVGTPMAATALFAALRATHKTLGDELAMAAAERRALRFEAVAYVDADHTPRVLDLTVAPYQDEGGAARGLLYVADDVTDAVTTKHQLLQAERLAAVGRLSAQVAHEIRNPLSAIGLNAELLDEEFAGALGPQTGEARALLRGIGAEVERLTEVTESYLQLARLPRPQPRHVDINQVVADLAAMLGPEMRSHGVEMTLDLGTPAPRASLDPGQLRQALLNVVRNGREAMPQGGTLRIRTRNLEGGVGIEVDDSGCGIEPTVLPRVLDPFFSTKAYGTGLGLSLTHQIIAEHAGTLRIVPRPEDGGGTRVVFEFPQVGKAA